MTTRQYGVAFLDVIGRGVAGGKLELDISEDEATALANTPGVEVVQSNSNRRMGDPKRWGVARVDMGSTIIADLKARPHVVTSGSGDGYRHSVITQCHEPLLGQLRRCDAGDGFVSVLEIQELVLAGELPFSQHEFEVMHDKEKWAKSRWAVANMGQASQSPLASSCRTRSLCSQQQSRFQKGTATAARGGARHKGVLPDVGAGNAAGGADRSLGGIGYGTSSPMVRYRPAQDSP
jgi:hypothetical protein